jgi:CRP-like cAMP-binding protein
MDDPQHKQRKLERELAHRVSALEHIEMFAQLTSEDRHRLADGMRPAPFGRGEIITRQDSAAHWLYVLAKGEVEVRIRGEGGAEKVVTRLSAPNVFGEMGVMTGERRTATVAAVTEVECYRIDKDLFKAVLRNRPEMMEIISQVMVRRRVELAAVREGLDAEAKRRRTKEERSRLLSSIQAFFGLDDDKV